MLGLYTHAITMQPLLGRVGRCFDHRLAAAALAQLDGLADAVAEEVELGATDHAGTLHFDLGDARRVQRELALDAFPLHDPPHRERLPRAAAGAGDHDAVEDLDPLL